MHGSLGAIFKTCLWIHERGPCQNEVKSQEGDPQVEGRSDHLLVESADFSNYASLQRNDTLLFCNYEMPADSKIGVHCEVASPNLAQLQETASEVTVIAQSFLPRVLYIVLIKKIVQRKSTLKKKFSFENHIDGLRKWLEQHEHLSPYKRSQLEMRSELLRRNGSRWPLTYLIKAGIDSISCHSIQTTVICTLCEMENIASIT